MNATNKRIITLGPPPTELNDVRILDPEQGVINLGGGGYRLGYRPVRSVIYLIVDDGYPWETETIAVEKRYSFGVSGIANRDFYRPVTEHGTSDRGRCECENLACRHLGLWEGSPSRIVDNDNFREALKKRLEHLVTYVEKKETAKEKALARKLADPVGHEARRVIAKEKREAKKAALAIPVQNPDPGQWPNRVAPGPVA